MSSRLWLRAMLGTAAALSGRDANRLRPSSHPPIQLGLFSGVNGGLCISQSPLGP
jgi:hypothetical protein